jgi:hypothetical protein
MLKRIDLLWLLAYPIYQIIGTIRHEASHAAAAWLEGAEITKFVFLPSILETYGFYWGYVQWHGATTWISTAAPYFCDLLTFVIFFGLLMTLQIRRHWLLLNLAVLGMISPLANSLYNYLGGLFRENDIGLLLQTLPSWIVHLYFTITMAFYLIGIIILYLWRSSSENPTEKGTHVP